MKRADVYEIITERILALMDKGVNPWRKPWQTIQRCARRSLPPRTR